MAADPKDLLTPEQQLELRNIIKGEFAQEAPETVREPSWWERPLMRLAETPVTREILKGAQFVEEKAIKPWAAAVTSPFSPATPGTEGKSWLQRELAEYEAWESPRFAKGAAELLSPVNLIPIGGTISLGAKGLGAAGLTGLSRRGTAIGRGVTTLEEAPGRFLSKSARAIAEKAVAPTLRRIKLTAVPPASSSEILSDLYTRHPERLTGATEELATINEAKMLYTAIDEQGEAMVEPLMSNLRVVGAGREILGITDDKLVTRATPLSTAPKVNGKPTLAYHDVMENYRHYKFEDPRAVPYIETVHEIQDSLSYMARKEGVAGTDITAIDELWHYVARKIVIDGKPKSTLQSVRLGAKPSALKERTIQFAQEGLDKGKMYADPEETLETVIRSYYKAVAQKRAASAVKTITRTAPPGIKRGTVITAIEQAGSGKPVSAAKLRAIRGFSPEIADKLASPITPRQAKNLIKKARDLPDVTARLTPSETWVFGHPELRGRIMSKEATKALEKAFSEEVPELLKQASDFSRGLVTMKAALDTSWPFIQGLPVLGHDASRWAMGKYSNTWARATKGHLQTIMNPQMYPEFRLKHAPTYEKYLKDGLIVGDSEFYAGLGGVSKVMGKVPKVGKSFQELMRQTYGRAGAGFSYGGEASRIMLLEAMEESWEGSSRELVDYVNRLTGVVSSRGMGVGAKQRALESAVLFAPRYLRANLSLIKHVFGRGATASEARKALAGMAAAMTASYVVICTALGQEPKLNPAPKHLGGNGAEFLTFRIGDDNIGIPGFWYSLTRLAANVGAIAQDDPEKIVSLNHRENPLLNWAFAKTAPTVHLTTEMVEGRDYFGNPLDSKTDYLKQIGDKFLTIAASSVITQDPKAGAPAFIGELAGIRTFPQSVFGERNELRNEYAMAEYGVEWDELNRTLDGRVKQRELENKYPDLAELTDKAKTTWSERAQGDDKRIMDYMEARGIARTHYEERLFGMEKKVMEGNATARDFREEAKIISAELGGAYNLISEQFSDIGEIFDRRRDDPEEDLGLAAYDEYTSIMYAPGAFEDPDYLTFDYTKYQEAEQEFIQKWGLDMYKNVRTMLAADDNVPAMYKLLQTAKTTLRPYWGIRESVLQQLGIPPADYAKYASATGTARRELLIRNPRLKQAENAIRRMRRDMLAQNPLMDRYYRLFYA